MNWTDIAAIAFIVASSVGAATVYLRLFVGQELAKHEEKMHEWLSRHYTSSRILDLRFEAHADRLTRLETAQSCE